jgi:uncharacterized membrane protein HdeD (DUF308 family)
MTTQAILVLVSSVLFIIGDIPYVLDTLKQKSKPRIVSWAVWGTLSIIAAFASLSDKQYPAAFLSFLGTIAIFIIVILGYKHGNRHFETLDVACFIGSMFGLVLWYFSGSPSLALVVVIAIDLVGTIPTVMHSWKKPHEETWITYALSAVGCILIVFAASDWRVTSVAYPLYSAISCVIFVSIILARKKYAVKGIADKPHGL